MPRFVPGLSYQDPLFLVTRVYHERRSQEKPNLDDTMARCCYSHFFCFNHNSDSLGVKHYKYACKGGQPNRPLGKNYDGQNHGVMA